MSSFQSPYNISGRPTWAEIHLENLAANFRQIKGIVSPAARVMAIVKADAYGHGAVESARRLAREGADWFGVAIPEEGIQLRAAGITQPILSLGGFWPAQAAACLQQRLTQVVYRLDMIESVVLLIGAFFVLVGSVGLLRLPDFLSRLHAPTKATTLGLGGATKTRTTSRETTTAEGTQKSAQTESAKASLSGIAYEKTVSGESEKDSGRRCRDGHADQRHRIPDRIRQT